MPAVSKKQQRFFGIVRAIQKGEQKPTTPETAKAASGMKMKSVKKFAKTKHKGLPEKKVQKEESCGKGMYYCNQRKKCMPIPKGSKVRKDGMLVKESVKDELLSRAEQKRKSFKQFRKDARMAGQKPLKRGEVRKYDSKTGTYVSNKKKKVDEMNQGPSTPVSMSGGKLQFNKGAAGIGKIRLKKPMGPLTGAPIPKV